MAYTINGGSFSTWSMTALSCEGALDFPKRLGEYEYDWGDSYGTEGFVSTDDLFWDGREIKVKVFYKGSNLVSSIDTLLSTLKGTNLTLVTTFGSHACRIMGIKTVSILKPNQQALLEISFWENAVPVSSAPAAVGGSGILLAGRDFYVDFGMHTKSIGGYSDVPDFYQRNLTYGSAARIMSGVRKNRTVRIELNGRYTSLATMISKVNSLRYLLMSSGLKSLVYRTVTKNTYFTDGAKVYADPKTFSANLILNLKIQE